MTLPLVHVHQHIKCDGCQRENFSGKRWACETCKAHGKDHDKCDECHKRPLPHPADHVFTCIEASVETSSQGFDAGDHVEDRIAPSPADRIAELEARNAELEAKNAELEDVSRTFADLLGSLTLRTPR